MEEIVIADNKKDEILEQYDEQKTINACNKAIRRAMVELSDSDYQINMT